MLALSGMQRLATTPTEVPQPPTPQPSQPPPGVPPAGPPEIHPPPDNPAQPAQPAEAPPSQPPQEIPGSSQSPNGELNASSAAALLRGSAAKISHDR